MIVVTGSLVARAETLAALKAVCIAHSERSRAEPGCMGHNVYADCENPLRLFFYEVWADRAALAAHFRVPESVAFMHGPVLWRRRASGRRSSRRAPPHFDQAR
jgi:quinol monooxygenase YgiN